MNQEVIALSIAENIRRLRESRGMSQTEFGKIAGVSDKAVSTWENGLKIPRMGAVQKLADYFGIQKSDILDDETDSSNLAKRTTTLTDIELRAAFFNGADPNLTDEDLAAMWEDVKAFRDFKLSQRKKLPNE